MYRFNSFTKITITRLLLPLLIAWLGICPVARAVTPPPDGGYAGANTAEGGNALFSLTTGTWNTAIGANTLKLDTTGGFNTALGGNALLSNSSGTSNTAVGVNALVHNTTGGFDTAVGQGALGTNTTASANTAIGAQALVSNSTGGANTANGTFALFSNTTGSENTAIGASALVNNTTGSPNTAIGHSALLSNTTGNNNTAIGAEALVSNTTGAGNTANGNFALFSNTTGTNNTALGFNAGENQTTGSNNVYIGAGLVGVAGESNACYIASIFGQTSGGGAPVLINATGKLGTTTSSRRFKEQIKPMGKASEALFALKPVSFRYKKEIDPTRTSQLGLVAEDVAKIDPSLVVMDKEVKPYTVRYEQVNAMLLNEFLKEHRRVEEQEESITQLKSKVAKQEAIIAQQQEGMEAVTARLNEQFSQIQKLSAQSEMGRLATKVATNNQY